MATVKTVTSTEMDGLETKEEPVRERKRYEGAQTNTKALEDEIRALEEEQRRVLNPVVEEDEEQEEATQEDDEPKTVEEITYKKRYGDLRAHNQKTTEENKRLKAELEALQGMNPGNEDKMPSNKEELQEFIKKYPDVYRLVKGVVEEEAAPVKQDLEGLKQREREAEDKLAKAKLYKEHPDLDELNESTEFVSWYKEQTEDEKEFISKHLFEDGGSLQTASKILTRFKNETGYGKKKVGRPRKDLEAAQAVSPSSSADPTAKKQEKIWKESEVAKMNPTEEQLADIVKAQREGRFEYDMANIRHHR